MGYVEGLGCGADGGFACLPAFVDEVEVGGFVFFGAAEFYTVGFGYGDAFGLALVVHSSFHFGEVAEEAKQ